MPIHLPPDYPDELKQLTRKIIAEAIKEFKVLRQFTRHIQLTKVCKRVVSKLTPRLCAAVGDEALSVMDNLLHYIRVENCDSSMERDQVRRETRESDEWSKLVEEMATVPSTGRPQGQPRETTGHKGDKPSKGRYQDRDEIILRVHNENPATPFREQCLKIATALYDDGKERGVVHHFPSAWGKKSPLQMLQSGSKAQRRKPVDLFRQVINRKSAKKRCKRRPTD